VRASHRERISLRQPAGATASLYSVDIMAMLRRILRVQRDQMVKLIRSATSSPGGRSLDGSLDLGYTPRSDGAPDPGEVVWTWVAYEDDPQQGKDRPVLVIGRRRGAGPDALVGLMLTSKDHDRDAGQEAQQGRQWMDVGSGDWDREHRPSEVRLDRLLDIDGSTVRREGAALDRTTFDAVVAAVRPYLP